MADAQKTLEIILSAKDEASEKLQNFKQKFLDLAKEARAGSLIITGALTGILKSSIDAASEFQQAGIAFETMLGNADKAKVLLQQISDFAAKTPFTLPEVLQGSKALLAMGASSEDLLPELKMLGDVAAGLGVPMDRLILNFGQVRTQGKLTGRELRDFSIAGVPLIETLANSLGKTKEQITEMVTEGKIGFPEVKKAFELMTNEGGRFNNLMAKQSKTFKGVASNIQDNLVRIKAAFLGVTTSGEVIEGGIFDRLSKAAEGLLTVLDKLTPKVTDFVNNFLNNREALFATIGGLTALLIPLAIALWGLIAPVIPFIALGVALGLAIAFIIKKFEEAKPIIDAWKESIVATIDSVKAKFDEIFGSIKQGIDNLKAWMSLSSDDIALILGFWEGSFEKWKTDTSQQMTEFEHNATEAVKSFVVKTGESFRGWKVQTIANFKELGEFLHQLIDIKMKEWEEAIPHIWENIKIQLTSKIREIQNFFYDLGRTIDNVIDKIKSFIDNFNIGRQLGLSRQHGGFIPGGSGDVVPTLLHGGERVIPRNGVDVNSGGGVGSLTIQFTGPVSMDSNERVQELADRIINILGRQNELATKGLAF